MHVEHKAADGHRRAGTIVDELIPGGVAMLGRVLTERTQQILSMTRGQVPLLKHCTEAQAFRIVAASAEQACLQPVKPSNFFRTHKLRVVGNIVGNANKFVERQDDRPVLPLNKTRCDREIFIVRALARSKVSARGHCTLVASA
jgi:hypothetical protein